MLLMVNRAMVLCSVQLFESSRLDGNIWCPGLICECFHFFIETAQVLRGISVPRVHKGLRTSISNSTYHYAQLKLRLREGQPPAIYHPYKIRNAWIPTPNCPASGGKPGWGTAQDILEIELRKLRRRRIPGEL